MLARAQHYQHNEMQTRAGFLTLGSPDRCLEDRVHLLLVPAPDDLLVVQPASPLVNSVKNEGPELLEDLSLFGQ